MRCGNCSIRSCRAFSEGNAAAARSRRARLPHRSQMESRAYAFITGLFVIGLIVAIFSWASWLAQEPEDRKPYRVVSTTPVSGLNAQAQVRYRGMGVGRVTSIKLDPIDRHKILIDIEVNSDVPVTRGTYAQLGMEGITGIAYVHLLDDSQETAPPPKGA